MGKIRIGLWAIGFVMVACGHEPVGLTVVPERCAAPIQSRVLAHVCFESPECEESQRILGFRNAHLDERMGECEAAGNSYLDCLYWVLGSPQGEARNTERLQHPDQIQYELGF